MCSGRLGPWVGSHGAQIRLWVPSTRNSYSSGFVHCFLNRFYSQRVFWIKIYCLSLKCKKVAAPTRNEEDYRERMLEMVLWERNPIFSNLSYFAISPMLQGHTLLPSISNWCNLMLSAAERKPEWSPLHPSSLFPVSLLAAAWSRQQSASEHMSLRTLQGTGPWITPTSRPHAPGSTQHVPAEHAPLLWAEARGDQNSSQV